MKDLKLNLLRFNQREQLKNDIANSESMLASAKPEEKGTIAMNIKKTKRQLEAQSPEPLTGKEKDSLHTLEKRLREKIVDHMPPEEVMRKNPAGAVDWHQKWEKANKPLIRMWKNIKIQLNPDNADRDLANIERYRPSGQMDRLRTDAQISGVMSYHGLDPELWPFDPPQNTAAKQAERRMTEEEVEHDVNAALEAFDDKELVEAAEGEPDKRKEISPERKAALLQHLEKARAVKAQKKLDEDQLETTLQAASVTAD